MGMQFPRGPIRRCLGRRLSHSGSVPLPGLPQGLGGSTAIAALDVSISISAFSRETDAARPLAVPLRAGVCRADPGRVADGPQGLGGHVQVRGAGAGRGLLQQLSPPCFRRCRLSRLRGRCHVPLSLLFIRRSSLLAPHQPTQGHCHVPPRISVSEQRRGHGGAEPGWGDASGRVLSPLCTGRDLLGDLLLG